jgi:hypothetical protein
MVTLVCVFSKKTFDWMCIIYIFVAIGKKIDQKKTLLLTMIIGIFKNKKNVNEQNV